MKPEQKKTEEVEKKKVDALKKKADKLTEIETARLEVEKAEEDLAAADAIKLVREKRRKAKAATVEGFEKAYKEEEKVKVKFIDSPTGLFNLAYNKGDKASFPKSQASVLIDTGVAEKA